jgi:hypothetical protein
VAAAAIGSDSCAQYVAAALVVLNSEDTALLDAVLFGDVGLLAVAKRALPLAALMTAYRAASPSDLARFSALTGLTNDLAELALRSTPEQRAAAGRALGLDIVWDDMIAVNISADKATAAAGAPVSIVDAA